mmetsp:Transcript_5606/g.11202  ORF Transcript_5606/g.11202 Transcript_5606/m.11202 type:complete len:208 (+) Transcript_5606:36-659(+)
MLFSNSAAAGVRVHTGCIAIGSATTHHSECSTHLNRIDRAPALVWLRSRLRARSGVGNRSRGSGVGDWEGGLLRNATNVHPPLHHDIPAVTPRLAPRVLDNVRVGSETYNEHAMIKVGSTRGIIKNSTRVALESGSVGLNGNADWLREDGSRKLVFITTRNIPKGVDSGNDTRCCVVPTVSIDCEVAVVILAINPSVVNDVLECIIH